ncbi:hypothetical protein QYE76_043536 [Lolium multiflorum]|uniref:Uncharacterized protein n=1 Tax=Lolium multiflorum TaxID=4521 RepID=A0AAD8TJ90_LOLMU|nr:hypothetical protein QYE76_043536 [Lolium multiflorum]
MENYSSSWEQQQNGWRGDGSGVDGGAFRALPFRQVPNETPSPHLGFAMAAALEGFAYRGLFVSRKHSQLNYGVDCGWLTEETRESDTKMIRGGPIFSVSNGGDDDHGANTAEIHGDELDDNLYDVVESLDRSLSPMQQLSTLQDIHNSTHFRT